jgi:hypothetical protein
MREMEEQAYRSELGEHSNRQDGHDWQQRAKLRALLFALKENPHGALHRGSFSSRSTEGRCASQMCRIGHRNSRWDVRHCHKGEIYAGRLLLFDENPISYSASISLWSGSSGFFMAFGAMLWSDDQ